VDVQNLYNFLKRRIVGHYIGFIKNNQLLLFTNYYTLKYDTIVITLETGRGILQFEN
jgi:hypothetical protein